MLLWHWSVNWQRWPDVPGAQVHSNPPTVFTQVASLEQGAVAEKRTGNYMAKSENTLSNLKMVIKKLQCTIQLYPYRFEDGIIIIKGVVTHFHLSSQLYTYRPGTR